MQAIMIESRGGSCFAWCHLQSLWSGLSTGEKRILLLTTGLSWLYWSSWDITMGSAYRQLCGCMDCLLSAILLKGWPSCHPTELFTFQKPLPFACNAIFASILFCWHLCQVIFVFLLMLCNSLSCNCKYHNCSIISQAKIICSYFITPQQLYCGWDQFSLCYI